MSKWSSPYKTIDGLPLESGKSSTKEPANTFYAGPTGGVNKIPTFRKIVSSDLPDGTPSFGGFINNGTMFANGTGTIAATDPGEEHSVLTGNGVNDPPSFKKVNLEHGTTSVLKIDKGGTGVNSTYTLPGTIFAGPLYTGIASSPVGPPTFRDLHIGDFSAELSSEIGFKMSSPSCDFIVKNIGTALSANHVAFTMNDIGANKIASLITADGGTSITSQINMNNLTSRFTQTHVNTLFTTGGSTAASISVSNFNATIMTTLTSKFTQAHVMSLVNTGGALAAEEIGTLLTPTYQTVVADLALIPEEISTAATGAYDAAVLTSTAALELALDTPIIGVKPRLTTVENKLNVRTGTGDTYVMSGAPTLTGTTTMNGGGALGAVVSAVRVGETMLVRNTATNGRATIYFENQTAGTHNMVIGVGGNASSMPNQAYIATTNANGLLITNILKLSNALATIYGGTGTTTSTGTGNNVLSDSPTFTGTISVSNATLTTPLAISSGGTGVISTTQNFAFLGPLDGNGPPIWRAITSADIPTSGTPTFSGLTSGAAMYATSATNITSATEVFMTSTQIGIGATPATGYALDITNSVGGSNLPLVRICGAGVSGNRAGLALSNGIARPGGDATRILAIDDGAFSSHLIFQTAPPGNPGNGVAIERVRFTAGGAFCFGTTTATKNFNISTASNTDVVFIKNTNSAGFGTINLQNNSNLNMYIGVGGTTTGGPQQNVPFIVTSSNSLQLPPTILLSSGTSMALPPITSTSLALTTALPVSSGGTGVATIGQSFAFLGPTSGSGPPTWRAITPADIPSGTGISMDSPTFTGTTTMNAGALVGLNITSTVATESMSITNTTATGTSSIKFSNGTNTATFGINGTNVTGQANSAIIKSTQQLLVETTGIIHRGNFASLSVLNTGTSSGAVVNLTSMDNIADMMNVTSYSIVGNAATKYTNDTGVTSLTIGAAGSSATSFPNQAFISVGGTKGLAIKSYVSLGDTPSNSPGQPLVINYTSVTNAISTKSTNSAAYNSIQLRNNNDVMAEFGVGGSTVGTTGDRNVAFISAPLLRMNCPVIQPSSMHTVITNWQSTGQAYWFNDGVYANYPLMASSTYYFGPSGTTTNYGSLTVNPVVGGSGTAPYWLMPVTGIYSIKWRWTASNYYYLAHISRNIGDGSEHNNATRGNPNLLAMNWAYYYSGSDPGGLPKGIEIVATYYASTTDKIYIGYYHGNGAQKIEQPLANTAESWMLSFTLIQRTG